MTVSGHIALDPFTLGRHRLRNRIVFPGHTTNFGVDSLPTPRHHAYLARRARGGAGLIITEAVRVHPTSAGRDSTLGSYHPRAVGAYAALADAVHEAGVPLFAQLMHAGRQAAGDSARTAAWAPSPISWTYGGPVPHAMTHNDIRTVVSAFGTGARRMADAGLDGVEIHLGHGHLIQQFLSPVTNTRSDGYGASPANRLRFAREVLAAVTSAVPDDVLVGLRVSAHEFLPGGLEPPRVAEAVESLTQEFRVDLLHISHSAYVGQVSLSTQIADMSHGPAPFRGFPRFFKESFPDVPVLAVCRVDDLAVAEELLTAGAADLVAMARAQIADPDLVRKTELGRSNEVRACLACNQACIGRIEMSLPLSCVVNPAAGEEEADDRDQAAAAAGTGRSILVVGAGPAGLTAAVTAAESGARVVLVEAADEVGGQVRYARRLAGRERLGRLTDDLLAAAIRSGVEILLGTRLGGAVGLRPQDFDHIVLATGAVPTARELAGIQILDVLAGVDLVGSGAARSVAVVDDEGTWIAAGLVEALARTGHRVHLVAPGPQLFGRVTLYDRVGLLDRLSRLRVSTHLARRPVCGTPDGLVVADIVGGEHEVLPGVDLVIDVPARRADDASYPWLDSLEIIERVSVVGDALAPRSLVEATHEARRAVLTALAPTGSKPRRSEECDVV